MRFDATLAPLQLAAGAQNLVRLQTLPGQPPDPKRPLRKGHFLAVLSRFDSIAGHDEHRRHLQASAAWRHGLASVQPLLRGPVETLRLQPTSRSALR